LKIAYLGPFINSTLQPYIDSLSDEDCRKSPGMGGYGLIELVEERLRRNQETVVITLDTHLQNESIIRKGDLCSLYSLPKRKTKSLRDLFKKERDFIQQSVLDSEPDIIHAHWTREYALTALKIDIPTIITAHDNPKDILRYMGWNYLPLYLLSNYIIKKANYITAVSPYVLDYIKEKRLIDFQLIPNPLPIELFEYSSNYTKKYDYNNPIITTVLDWNELKNPKNAILGFHLILKKYPDAQLHLFGEGMGEYQQCEQWCLQKKLRRNIVFHGKIKNEHLRKHLKTTTVLLHTSRTEACSMIINEGMALGIPCIGGKYSGGVPWQLDFGNAGMLTDINDPLEISNVLLTLLASIDRMEEIGIHAKIRAGELFNPKLIFDKWEMLYNKILDNTYGSQ
jgi:L-malate glycosyltransferase